ncbi:MAG: CocE/NonD family hydrolase [Sinimarinibacterium sp.]|jgi:hypothetical protein
MIRRAARLSGLLLLLFMLRPCAAQTQTFKFAAPAGAADPQVPALMRDLAERILPVYADNDQLRYLGNLSMLQLTAGAYEAAQDTRETLQKRRNGANATPPVDWPLLDVYAQAKAALARNEADFAPAFGKLLQQTVSRLSDEDAYALTTWHGAAPETFRIELQAALDSTRGTQKVALPQALDLVRLYLRYQMQRETGSLVDATGQADARRRYVIDDDVSIRTAYGVVLHARVVRPKKPGQRPTLLQFTIDRTQDGAVACAAHGYVGVTALTRDTSRERGRVTPFRHDGEDARAVIRWIAGQPWSDGRVGMYGSDYSGFAAWAAAKHPPGALKAIATSNPIAPGIDFPTTGRIYRNSAYRWATNHTHGVDEAGVEDPAFWRALDLSWYRSGRDYRALDSLAKRPNSVFRLWLGHPSYDRYWQKMVPFDKEFARIDIPVLTIAGYYADNGAGSLYYFTQHSRHRANADDTLLIGPYDDAALRSNPSEILRNHAIDPGARIDLQALRFQWFDHVFRSGEKPALLQGRVNYQVMGADRWAHAPSLEAIANARLRFYLAATKPGGRQRLAPAPPSDGSYVEQTVNFAGRGDADRWQSQTDIVRSQPAARHGVVFVSAPLEHATEISGPLSLRLDFLVNKMDVDLYVAAYEQRPDGSYLLLSDPYEQRASYARDRKHRHLLKAGKRQQLTLTSTRMMSRRLEAGARLVLVLGINKRPDRELNYGTGKDVSVESIADAGHPLKLRWYGDSYVEIPLRQ